MATIIKESKTPPVIRGQSVHLWVDDFKNSKGFVVVEGGPMCKSKVPDALATRVREKVTCKACEKILREFPDE